MKKIKSIALFVFIAVGVCLVSIGKAPAANSGQWEVLWTTKHCAFICPYMWRFEPNYGQALKLKRTLEEQGFAVRIFPEPGAVKTSPVPAPPPAPAPTPAPVHRICYLGHIGQPSRCVWVPITLLP